MGSNKNNGADKSLTKTKENNTTPLLIEKIGQRVGNKILPNSVDLKSITDEELKEISKSWTAQDWESYLSTIDTSIEEQLLDEPISIEEISEEQGPAEIFSMIHEEHPEQRDKLERTVRKILRLHLTKREYEVVWLRYWEQMSQREISKALGLSRRGVRILLNRGHEKFKKAVLLNSLKRSRNLNSL